MYFKILIRQILKHWKGLLPVAIVWLIGGYYFFSSDHTIFRSLFSGNRSPDSVWIPDKHWFYRKISRFFLSFPEEGEENPARAYDAYVRPALDRLDENSHSFLCSLPFQDCPESGDPVVALRFMESVCDRLPAEVQGDPDLYRPHWLELIGGLSQKISRNGNPDRGISPVIPEDYWISRYPEILESLKDLVHALSYAYVIPVEILPDSRKKEGDLLIPLWIDRVAHAACRPLIGKLAWGDYIDFLEKKEEKTLLREADTSSPVEPEEMELLVIRRLRKNPYYLRALEEYASGIVPDPFLPGSCHTEEFILSCHSPRESLKVIRKLLLLSGDRNRPGLSLKAARLLLGLYISTGDRSFREDARNSLAGALKSFHTEREARSLLVRLSIYEKDYEKALDELLQLELLLQKKGIGDPIFEELARTTLEGLGYFREADCFSPYRDLTGSPPKYCQNLSLQDFAGNDGPPHLSPRHKDEDREGVPPMESQTLFQSTGKPDSAAPANFPEER